MVKQMTQGYSNMKYALTLIGILSIFLALSANSADDTAVSIAVVDVTYLMENSPEAELASQTLRAKFTPRELELAKEQDEITQLEAARQRNRSLWSEEEVRKADREIRSLKRKRARALEDFREELRFARDSALDGVQKSVFSAITAVRVERNIDIVIQEYVSASDRVNLTPFVMKYLENKLKKRQIDNAE
ncbi:MAG: OmpH family outer membrane protein, partial [Leucothrix sp.]